MLEGAIRALLGVGEHRATALHFVSLLAFRAGTIRLRDRLAKVFGKRERHEQRKVAWKRGGVGLELVL
jgi:hypothetical protein